MIKFDKNIVTIIGTITGISKPFTVGNCKDSFKEYIVSCNRQMKTKSNLDSFIVIIPESLENEVGAFNISYWSKIKVIGQIRSYHETINDIKRLCLKVFATQIITDIEEDDNNQIEITGSICKYSELRKTSSEKSIFDFMIASNFKYHKSVYVPCIAFESIGQKMYEATNVGTKYNIIGQLQTRAYFDKKVNTERTITELCVKKFEIVQEEEK